MLSSILSRSGLFGLPGYLKTIMSPRRISRCGRKGRRGPGPKTNLLTSRWSPTVMVFSIDAVGTLTAWTSDSRSRPLGLTERELNAPVVSFGFFSVVVADSVIADIVEAGHAVVK